MRGNLRKLLVLSLVLMGTAESQIDGASPDANEAPLKIAIHIINNASLEKADLEEAGEITAGIFRKIGVEVVVALQRDKDSNEMAMALPRNSRFYVFIVANGEAKRMGLQQYRNVMGSVRCNVEDENCGCVCIFEHAASRLLREKKTMRKPVLLGHAIAHEMGHILLKRESHSRSGIMQANWGPEAMWGMLKGSLSFHPDEVLDIRESVASRGQIGLGPQASNALIAR